MAAANLLLLALVVCGIAALSPLAGASRALPMPTFTVEGNVFCDTCQAGFETTATTYIHGAKVRVECRDGVTAAVHYTAEGSTDKTGSYKIVVDGEHSEDVCESVLVSSPDPDCASPLVGRERARIVLSHNNGVVSDKRVANSLGFRRSAAVDGCAEVMKMYQLDENSD